MHDDPDSWPAMMTVPEVAAILRVSPMTVYRMVKADELHGSRVSKKMIRVNSDDLRAYLKRDMPA